MRALLRTLAGLFVVVNLCASVYGQAGFCQEPPGLANAADCAICRDSSFSFSTAAATPSNPGGPWCGSGGVIDNDMYFGFFASATSAIFEVTVSDCSSGTGIQVAVFDGDRNQTGNCFSTAVTPGQTVTITATGLQIGGAYLLGIDGFAGSICSYTVTPVSGLLTGGPGDPGPIVGPDTVCFETSHQYTVGESLGASGYYWLAIGTGFAAGVQLDPPQDPALGNPDRTVTLNFPPMPQFMPPNTCSDVILRAYATNPCLVTALQGPDTAITIAVCRGPADSVRFDVCYGDMVEYPPGSGNMYGGPGQYFVPINVNVGPFGTGGCDKIDVITIVPDFGPVDPNLRPVVLCQDGDFTQICPDAVPNEPPGAIQCTIPSTTPGGCDTAVLYYLVRLDPEAHIEAANGGSVTCQRPLDTLHAVVRSGSTPPSTQGDSVSYAWFDASNAQVGTGEFHVVSTPGTYRLVVTMFSHFDPSVTCTDETTYTVIDATAPPSVPTLSGDAQICAIDFPTDYTASGASGPFESYVWTVTPPTGVTFSTAGAVLTVTDAGTLTSYQVCVAVDNGCATSTQDCITTSVLGSPVQTTLAGPDSLCAGESGSYTLGNYDAAYTYTVTQSPTGASATISGGSVAVTMGTASGQLCVTVGNSCETLAPVCVPIGLRPEPVAVTPSGNLTACPGETVVYALTPAVPAGASLDATVTNGTIVSSTASVVAVQWTAAGMGQLCVGTTNACGSSTPECINVTITDPGAATVSGGGTYCAGNNDVEVVFDFTGTPPFTYTYTVDGGAPVTATTSNTRVTITTPGAGTYELTAYASSGCDGTFSGQAVVSENVAPSAVVSGGATVCTGDDTDIVVTLTGAPSWTFDLLLDGVSQGQQTATASPYTVSVSAAGTYTVANLVDGNGCPGTASGDAVVAVTTPIAASTPAYTCEPDGESYRVRIDLTGGDAVNYAVTPVGAGTFAGGVFTSGLIDSGTPFSFTFSDGTTCPSVTVTDQHSCPCVTEAGTLSTTLLEVCVTAGAVADVAAGYDASSEVLDPNDIRLYVLHTGSGTTLTGVIATNTTGQFAFDPATMTYGTTYYVSVVVGDDDGSGGVDLADPCTIVLAGTPVRFLETPTATLVGGGNICFGGDTTVVVNFTGTGPFELVYLVNSVATTITSAGPSETISLTGLTANTTVELQSVRAAGCVGTVNGTASIAVSTEVQAAATTECNGTATGYTVTITISGGDPASYVVEPALGVITGNTFVSAEIPQGSGYSFTVYDGARCNEVTLAEAIVPCDCISDAGTHPTDTLRFCGSGTATVAIPTDTMMDADDVLNFVLHDSPLPTLGTVLLQQPSGSFAFDPAVMSYGTVYYVSAVMGSSLGGGVTDLTDVCLDVAAGVPVVWYEVPEITLAGTQDVCVGDPINLTFTLVGSDPVTVTYGDGTTTWDELLQPGSNTVAAPLTTSATYTLVSATINGCPATLSGTAMVGVHDAPVGGAISVEYNSTVTQYRITFNITGGDPGSYTVNGVAVATLPYVSDWIDCGLDYSFLVDDQWNCSPDLLAGPVNCDCLTAIGTLSGPFASCDVTEDATVTYDATGENLDGDDAVEYILHAGDVNSPIARGPNPTFPFDAATMTLGVTYYVTAVAGNAVGGTVDLADDCTVLSDDVPVIWSEPPTATLSGGGTVCPGVPTDLTFDITGPGSITVVYSDGTNSYTEVLTAGANTVATPRLDSADYSIVSVTSAACAGTFSGSAAVRILDGITVSPARVMRNGTNTQYRVEFTISGGDPATYTVAPATGTLTGAVFVSDWIDCGTAYAFAFDDAGGCSPVTRDGNPDCNCLSAVGALSGAFETCDVNEVAAPTYDPTGENLDGDDALEYLLYLTDFNSPIARNATGQFAFDPATMTRDIVYSIVAVVGNATAGQVDLGDPCLAVSTVATAAWYTEPSVTVTAPAAICAGDDWVVTVTVAGSGLPKEVTYTLDGVAGTLPGVVPGTPATLTLTVSSAATLVITGVSDANCATPTNETLTVAVGSEITTTGLDEVCNGAGTEYRVVFTINGGDAASYSVVPAGTITQTGPNSATFESAPIATGNSYSFTISDASACFSPVVSGIHACNCTSDAGTMDPVSLTTICPGDELVSTHLAGSWVTDANDALIYALRTSDDQSDFRDDAIALNTEPRFPSAGLTAGQTYYITPIVGDDDGSGTDVLDGDPCLDIGVSAPFFVRPEPTGSLVGDTLICETGSADITLVLVGVGPFDVTVTNGDNGTDTSFAAIQSPMVYTVDPNNPTTYILSSVTESSDPRCSSQPNATVTVGVEELVNAGLAGAPLDLCEGAGELVALADRIDGEDAGGTWTQTGGPDASVGFDAAAGTLRNQGLAAGTYEFTYRIGSGMPCPTDDEAIVVDLENAPTADAGPDRQLTCDEPVVDLGTPASGSNRYEWTGGTVSDPSSAEVTTSAAGTYTLRVIGAGEAGCTDEDEVTVEAAGDVPTFDNLVVRDETCYQDGDGAISTEVTGGVAPYTFTLAGSTTSSLGSYGDLAPGQYDLQVVDAEGCEYVETIVVEAAKQVTVDAGPDVEIEFGQGHPVDLALEGDIETVTWSGDSLECVSAGPLCDQVVLYPSLSGVYQVSVVDSNGCEASDLIQLILRRERPVFIPSAFSPNGDGVNDRVWVSAAEGVVDKVLSFTVHNRWGESVFELGEHDPNVEAFGWDGRFRGEILNPAVFAYAVLIRYTDGTEEVLEGDITLVANN